MLRQRAASEITVMVSHARPEDFTSVQSDRFKELTENELRVFELEAELEELKARCIGLEAENEFLRKGSDFTDGTRSRILAWMDELSRRWKLLGESE